MTNTPDIKRNPNESVMDYLVRIGDNLEAYELTWTTAAPLLNEETDEEYSESKWRKDYQSYLRWKDYISKKYATSDEFLDEIRDQTVELEKIKMQVRDQRREYKNLIRPEARFEGLHQDIIESVGELSKVKPLYWDSSTYTNDADKEAAIILSDWHKGLFARNYWNNFDNEEFYKRVNKVVVKTIEYAKLHKVKTLHVFSLGDLVNGLIHVTTRINSVEDVITQTMSVAETLSEIMCKFANEFEQVKFYQCRGNHDRLTPNKNDEIAKESLADIVPWFMKERLSHIGNIEFMENTYDDEIIVTEILGNKIIAVHGHRDRVSNVADNLTHMTKTFADYIFLGHTHHHEENEHHGTEIIVNSSLSGVDSYAKEIRKTSKPAQKLIIFDKFETRLTTYNIRLDRIG